MGANVTGNRRDPLAKRGNDCYETPHVATAALIRAVKLPHRLWEPCCGPGAIVKVLRAAGHEVIASDLVDYGCPSSQNGIDFLTVDSAPPGVDTIVTNPPYKICDRFVAKALSLVPNVVALLRIGFIESERRRGILDGGRLSEIHVFRRRLPMMHRRGFTGAAIEGSAMAFAWYRWTARHRGAPEVRRIGFARCTVCRAPFVGRPDAVTCSSACRQRAYRGRIRTGVTDNAR
jgi:hypothetical protein